MFFISRSQFWFFEDLDNLINQLDPPFVILGDLNAHSVVWDGTRTNEKGLLIERLLAERHISLLNYDKPTYFNVQNNSTSVIDLGLCSSNVFVDFSWKPSDDLHGSDHFPIILKLNQPAFCPKMDLSKADWPSFRSECSKIDRISALTNYLEAYEAFINIVTAAAEKTIPKTSPT